MNDLKQKLIKKLSHPSYADHKISFSRRDFVRYGLISAGASFMPWTALERAMAATQSNPRVPFLVFDLQGGASLTGNFLVGKAGGPEDLCNYKRKGWNPRAQGAYDKIFGLPMNSKTGNIYAGMKETLPEHIFSIPNQNFLKMASLCNFSVSDNPDNNLSAITLITKAGLVGKFETNGIGPRSTNSGGYSNALLKETSYQPKSVATLKDLISITRFNGEYEQLSDAARKQTMTALLKSAKGNQQLEKIYAALADKGAAQPSMDPRSNQEIYNLYPIEDVRNNVTIEAGNALELQSGIVYNVLSGNCGPGVVQIVECDYHDVGQPNLGANKDREIGQAIGRAVKVAHILKTPLFFQIISDGGVTSPAEYEMVWDADSNDNSMSVIGYYDPKGKIEQSLLQIGDYTASGQVNLESVLGKDADKAAMMVKATLLNYLSVNGLKSEDLKNKFDAVADRLPDGTMDKMLAFV